MKRYTYLIISIFLIHLRIASFSQVEDPRITRLNTQLEKLNKQYPQQKIYLQFDHPYYTTKDKILLKAYVLSYSGSYQDTISTNLYIEMIDAKEMLTYITIVRLENGVGVTQIDLKDTIQAGVYKFKAFTNWSRNFNDEFNYSRYILIAPEGVTKEKIEAFKNYEKVKSNDVEISFFAEGGNFISGLKNKIVIQSNLNEFNDVDNIVLAEKTGLKIIDIELNSSGIASFEFNPDPKKSYLLNYEQEGKSKSFELPEFKKSGYVLDVDIDYEKEEVHINLETNVEKTLDIYANSVFFMLQSGGEKLFLEKHILKDEKINFSYTLYDKPVGLLLLTVFDDDLIPVAERIIFNPIKQKLPEISLSEKRINDTMHLVLKTETRLPKDQLTIFAKKYSDEILDLFDDNMKEYLLFTAYLPDFYFQDDIFSRDLDIVKLNKLDNILITQEWQRYNWNNIISDQFPYIKYQREKFLVVSGTVRKQLIKLPLENSPVNLTVLNEFYFNKHDTTDAKGRFYFDGIDLYDTIKVKLVAKRYINDKEDVYIEIDDADLPEHSFDKSDVLYTWYKKSFKAEIKSDRKNYNHKLYANDTVQLEDDNRFRLYGEADHVIDANNDHITCTYIADMIRGKVPGVMVAGTGTNAQYSLRGNNMNYSQAEPLYLIDGVSTDRFTFNSISPHDVDKIEVIYGVKSAIYGIRGGNGALAVYTKQGYHMIKGKVIFDMLGYQNIKDHKNIPVGRHFNAASTDWFPFISFNDSESFFYIKTNQKLTNDVRIEGILNGIPISERQEIRKE
ncbi:TonB-dependent receptor [Bacteroidota bacterium]